MWFCPEYFESSSLPLIANVLLAACFLFHCESFCFYKWHFLKWHTEVTGVGKRGCCGSFSHKKRPFRVYTLQNQSYRNVQCGKCSLNRSYTAKMLLNTINSAWEFRLCFFFDQLSRYKHFLGIPSSHTHTYTHTHTHTHTHKDAHRRRSKHSNMRTLHTGSDCTFPALRIYRLIYFALCFIFTALSFHVRERPSLKSSQCLQAARYDVTPLKWPGGKYPLAANLILWH